MVHRHVATPLHTPAARHSHAHTLAEVLRLRHAADAFASASSFFREGGAGAMHACVRGYAVSPALSHVRR